MSKKYVIEIKPEYEDTIKGIMVLGARKSNLYVDTLSIENLEELNSDYINEHYGQLQDEAYKRGFEDGKWKSEDGCTGCQYEGKVVTGPPCITCCNSYKNQWTAKKQDDEINVGDEVDWSGDKFIVTRIFQPHNNAEECDGVDMDGCTYHDVLISGLTKTGRHVDITDMLKGALE